MSAGRDRQLKTLDGSLANGEILFKLSFDYFQAFAASVSQTVLLSRGIDDVD